MRIKCTTRVLRHTLLGGYLTVCAALFVYFNLRLSVEWVGVILLGAAFIEGRGALFLKDWGVFVTVLVGWQLASPLATGFNFSWHLQALIDADRFLFGGQVPAVWLQQRLYHPHVLEFWDVLAVTIYLLHFFLPLLAGFIIWMKNRDCFHRFALAFMCVALGGFVTYIIYPAVPPWMAAQPLVHVDGRYLLRDEGHVYLHGVANLFQENMGRWYNPHTGALTLGWLHGRYDQVGAVPSEHAAFPLLFFLFLRRLFPRAGYLVLVYLAGVLFSITYLGQHYMIDAIVGFGYALCAYWLVMYVGPRAWKSIGGGARGR